MTVARVRRKLPPGRMTRPGGRKSFRNLAGRGSAQRAAHLVSMQELPMHAGACMGQQRQDVPIRSTPVTALVAAVHGLGG